MPTPEKSRSHSLIVVLIAIGALTALVLGVVGLNKLGGDEPERPGTGSLRELRADEFADAVLKAREKAGSWKFLEVSTIDGRTKQVWEGTVEWAGGDDVAMSYRPQGGQGEFRLVDGSWYYNDVREQKKPWIKLMPGGSNDPIISALLKEADPRRQVAIFRDPAAFQVVGAENIGTAVAVHYRVTVPVERVREATGNPVVGEAGADQVYDVWLDVDDQIVKLDQPSSVGEVQMSEVRTFSGYGDDFGIEAPPADQVQARRGALLERSAAASPSASPAG